MILSTVNCIGGRWCLLLSMLYCIHARLTSWHSTNACCAVSRGACVHILHDPSMSILANQLPNGSPSICRSQRNVLTFLGNHPCHILLYVLFLSCKVKPLALSFVSYLVGLILETIPILYPCFVVYSNIGLFAWFPAAFHCHSLGSHARSSIRHGWLSHIDPWGFI